MQGPISPDELARIIDSHAAALRLFAAQWTPAAEDCVQEALLQLVRQKRCPENVLAWLYRVVRNRAISSRRAETRRERHEQSAATHLSAWFEAPDSDGLDPQLVTQSLAALPTELREIVVAHVWGELTFEQIASVVGASRSTVHRRYHEALELLRSKLELPWLTDRQS